MSTSLYVYYRVNDDKRACTRVACSAGQCIELDGAGQVYWNGEVIAAGVLEQKLGAAAQVSPQPELHLRELHLRTRAHLRHLRKSGS